MHLLLARGARQELQDERDRTALRVAVNYNRPSIVELLCAAPGAAAALALRDKEGATPLICAVCDGSGSERLVAALLAADAAGALIDAQTSKGDSALIWASLKGHEGAVRLLLARGARQELQNEDGATALHAAARRGHAGIVELLCAAPGAADALELRDKDGAIPLAIADRTSHAACAVA